MEPHRPIPLALALLAPQVLLVLGPVFAMAADPLESPECRRSMERLRMQEAALPASAPAPAQAAAAVPSLPPALREARRQAARACLGTQADTLPAPPRRVEPPVGVLPPAPPRLVPARPVPAPAPVLSAPPAPATLTSCDPGGCWTSDGTRLQRVGPNLLGPRGFCTVTAAQPMCP
jgi:hypothetical protein